MMSFIKNIRHLITLYDSLQVIHRFADLVSVMCSKGHMPGILHCFTHQGIPTGKQQGLLNGGRVVSDHVHHQLHILWLSNLSVIKNKYYDLNKLKSFILYAQFI